MHDSRCTIVIDYLPGLARGHAAAAQPGHASDLKMTHSRRTMHLPLHDDSCPPHTTYSAGAGSI